MNAEYVWWLVLLVAVGIGIVTYLALGPVPEIPEATADGGSADSGPADSGPGDDAIPGSHGHEVGAGDESPESTADDQSSPVSTTEPGPGAPSSTSDTP